MTLTPRRLSLFRLRRFWMQFYWLLPAAMFLYAALQAPRWSGVDTYPTPDAQEYALLANRLAAGQPPLIGIGLNDYPSRYPLTYPLLLVPFAWIFQFDVTHYHWASTFYGLLAVILMARVGAWMLGSRAAGGLAAAFFAWHPQTVRMAVVNMSENGILFLFFAALALARPWLGTRRADPAVARRRTAWRGAVLGLILGWLTLSKAPFAWWALALAALALGQAAVDRRWRPAVVFLAAGLVCVAADLFYRRWAFGQWGMNGYQFWFPGVYDSFFKTFNWRYLHQPFDENWPVGNWRFYSRMALGQTHDFYGPYMAAAAAGSLVCLVWPRRRRTFGPGRPTWTVVGLWAGWGAVGAAFCLFYFFQEQRFLYLWIPLVDLLAAWGLAQVWSWEWLRRGWRRRVKVRQWVRIAAILAAFVILRGEYRRIEPILRDPGRPSTARAIEALLAGLPEGAWVFSNYETMMVEQYRSAPGPTGVLYLWLLDRFQNSLPWPVAAGGLPPRRPRGEVRRTVASIPVAWREGPTVLIDANNRWVPAPRERRELFARPAYLIVVRPDFFPLTNDHLREVIFPLLETELRLETIQHEGNVTLYRATGGADE